MGENIVGFLGVFSLVCAVVILLVSKDLTKKFADSDKYQESTRAHRIYGATTTISEVLIVASMGWYWSASGFLLLWIVASSFHDGVKKAREVKATA